MYDVFLKRITIENVRHLQNVTIPLNTEKKKHLILTGKNGSGKTSLLRALSQQLNYLVVNGDLSRIENMINFYQNNINKYREQQNVSDNKIAEEEKKLQNQKNNLESAKAGLTLEFNVNSDALKAHFDNGEFVLALYEANRKFDANIPKHVEKVELKDNYGITESPRNEFVKYILDLKMTEALARISGKNDRADSIHNWFDNFGNLLKQIFDDESIQLLFDEETFAFSISQSGRKKFNFQELSDGFAAILDIVVDLMVRMEKHLNGGLGFDLPGIVLIDEIETHLHLELQRKVLDFLINVFPNIQFVVSTHSPFILSSAKNAVIFDMESKTLVENGLSGLPYDGIVRGYFEADSLSRELREKFKRYRFLTGKKELSDDEIEEIAKIETYLDEIPDYLALEITTEYRRIKMKFDRREDL